MTARECWRMSPPARFMCVGLPGLLAVFLSVSVASGQPASNGRRDSAGVVALVLSSIERLPPDDSGLRRVPWRVTVVDSTSHVLRAAAAGVTAAIGARPASDRDSVQAILELWWYSAGARVRRLRFSVATIGRCGATWSSAWASVSSYEVVARRTAKRWVTGPPTMIAHGSPTLCMPRPELVPDRPVRRPPDDS